MLQISEAEVSGLKKKKFLASANAGLRPRVGNGRATSATCGQVGNGRAAERNPEIHRSAVAAVPCCSLLYAYAADATSQAHSQSRTRPEVEGGRAHLPSNLATTIPISPSPSNATPLSSPQRKRSLIVSGL